MADDRFVIQQHPGGKIEVDLHGRYTGAELRRIADEMDLTKKRLDEFLAASLKEKKR